MAEALPAEPRRVALSIPSWLFSVFFHAALIVVLGLTIQAEPLRTAGEEAPREVGVVLKQLDRSGATHYQGQDDGAAPPSSAPPSPRQLVGDQPPIDIASALPKAKEIIGIGGLPGEGSASARQMTGDRAPAPKFRAGMGRTKVYGLSGQGFKFVYCFDHSLSMGGSGHNALQAAKAELLASLNNLGPTHQFQIIFYNDHPTIFDIAGHAGRLVFGNEQNKQQAQHFIEGMKASGGTDHEAALDMALNLNPDVVFFLTDADQPAMTTSQLARVRRRNHGATINAIEFGLGPSLGDENFLMRMARENGGGYTYIDLTKSLRPMIDRRAVLALGPMLAICMSARLAAEEQDVVIVSSVADPQARLRSTGKIVDYTGRELVLELPSGSRRQYPAAQVIEIQTQHSAEQTAADALFAEHQFAPASAKYQQAIHAEKRRWMGRQMMARLVECARELGQVPQAGDYFLAIVRDDPTTGFFPLIPLAWLSGEVRPEIAAKASGWLARPEAAAVLLGASWLLGTSDQPVALSRLEGLTTSSDPSIAALAEAQSWRVRFAAADNAQLAIWQDKLERFPDSVRAGPCLVLGRALVFHHHVDLGVTSLLRVPILDPGQRTLAAEALWLAADALRSEKQSREAATLYRELATDYPDARWAAEARNRLAELVGQSVDPAEVKSD